MKKTTKIAKLLCLTGFSLGLVLTTGCASIVGGTNQSISLETRSNAGEPVAGVNCKLENPKGTWFVTTPGSVTIHRAYDDLSVYCTKAGEQPGIATVKSSTKGMAFGNILFGGVIGVGVDAATGAAYDYPALITIQLGSTAMIAPPATNKVDAPSVGTTVVAPTGADAKVTPAALDGGKASTVGFQTTGTTTPGLPQ